MLCTNTQFAQTFCGILKVDYFEAQSTRILFGIIYDYVLHYNREIDQNNMMILAEEYVTQRGYQSDVYAMLKDEIKVVFRAHIVSEDFVKDNLTKFVKAKAFRAAITESLEITSNGGDYEKAVRLIDNAISVGDTTSRGFWFEDFAQLPETYKQYYDVANLVETGFPDYDRALGGGMAPGELHVIMAPPKTGKTTLGVNIGTNVLLRGKTVFHVSLELKKHDIALKYANRMTGLNKAEILHTKVADYQQKMADFANYKPNLYIEYWTMYSINTITIRSWISQIRAKTSKSPNLIIVDYDDLLKPVEGKTDNQYADSGGIYGDLIALGDHFKCPVLTFAQPQRGAWNVYQDKDNPRLITMSDLAHSAMKAHHCTSITTLNFKLGEEEGIMYTDISRRGESHVETKVRKDYTRSLIKQVYTGTG